PGTPAAALHDETPHAVKLARLQQLQAVLDDNVKRISASRLHTVQRVLVEGTARKNEQQLFGRTECNRAVVFEGPRRLIGQMVDVRITEAPQRSLRGEVVTAETLA
ncbi:MAG: TRAM domain-containing protein, partial [Rhodoferax sp.]|nr:TRAM domain-containing protein [Rhodoferax sp.]